MATITGLTAERMLGIEAASIVDGEIVSGNLILTKHDGTTINAGPVVGPAGPTGPAGPAGSSAISAIPGEVKLWSGSALPVEATYGKWRWADGAVYPVASHPLAAAHIATAWRTFGGASDPGGSNFRVPDLRGLTPVGLDAMPGGIRANRMTRAVAITLAGRTGEEIHFITVPEMPAHTHPSADGQPFGTRYTAGSTQDSASVDGGDDIHLGSGSTSTGSTGGGQAHENVQPTVFVPYIVYLDG